MKTLELTLWILAVLLGSLPVSLSTDMQTIIINLSSKNLPSVPRTIPPSAEALDLSQNLLRNLNSQDFNGTPGLKFLNLSWNVLENIDPGTFSSIPQLENLDLSHNRLHNLSNQPYLLQAPNLRDLDLTFNRFINMTLGKEFQKLGHLQRLALSAEELRNGDFASLANLNLQTFTLNIENLTSHENKSLQDVTAERVVFVLSNREVDLAVFGDAVVKFKEVELIGYRIGLDIHLVQFGKAVLEHGAINVTHLYLTSLEAPWDQITAAINLIFLSTIKHLTASDIRISKMNRGTTVGQTSSLESFSIRRATVAVFIFSQEELLNFFINMPVQNLTIAQSPIVHMTCPQSLSKIRMLDFSDCALSENVFSPGEGQECETLVSLETLVLRGNNLRHLQLLSQRVRFMDALKHLDLSQNALTYNEFQGHCLWPLNITNINLASNGFDQSVFKCLPITTVHLDLQNNQITVIPANLSGLASLEGLDLSANRLLELPDCSGFPNLQRLFARANSLHAPSIGFLGSCPSLRELDASYNPYICTCALQGFITLVDGTGLQNGTHRVVLLHWPGEYRCSYPEAWSKTPLADFSLPAIVCSPSLLAATILVPAITLVIAMAILCKQLDGPWYLGMIWRWTRAKHRARTNQSRPEDLQGLCFHAFVSYSQRDVEWVKAQLLPKLEGEDRQGLRVCHHERDFVPGKTIVNNILSCVEKSRRCIFVLSSHFVRSEWCHYELYFASHQRMAGGLDSVILVLLEPLPLYLIPSKYYQLKAMMARRTYLEWPQDRAKQRLFWANLRAALQADLPTDPETDREGGGRERNEVVEEEVVGE